MPQHAPVQKEKRKQLPPSPDMVAFFFQIKHRKYTQGDGRIDDVTLKLIKNSGHVPATDQFTAV